MNMALSQGSDSNQNILSWAVLFLLAVLVAWMSSSVVWLGDDVDYAFVIHDHVWTSNGHIESVGDLVSSQVNHWQNTNGRVVAHTLVQLFCGVFGQGFFVVCNAMAYMVFAFLVLRVAGLRRINWRSSASVAAMILLSFVTKMMPSCQIGFVWMFCLTLAWLWLFINKAKCRWPVAVAVAFLGVLAGNGQEALSIGVSAATGIWWLRRKCRVGARRTLWLVCYWAGTLSACLAPGTLARSGRLDIAFGDSLLYMLLALRVVYVLAAVMLWLHFGKHVGWRSMWRSNALYLNAVLVLLAFNIYIGVYSNRQLFGAELMALVALVRLLPRGSFSGLWLAIFSFAAVALCIHQVDCARNVARQYKDIISMYLASPDGVVQYDRTLGSLNPFDREFRIYEDITGYGAHETRRTLVKSVADKYPYNPPLRLFPMAINRLTQVADTAVEFAPQHYMVMVTEGKPEKFRIESHNALMPWIKYVDESVADGYPALGDRTWYVTLVAPWRPFVKIDRIYAK